MEGIVVFIMDHFAPTAAAIVSVVVIQGVLRAALAFLGAGQGDSGRVSMRVLCWGVSAALALGPFYLLHNVELPLPPTEYGAGYSRYAFNKVRVDDSEASVYKRLGEPLRVMDRVREEKRCVVLVYSRVGNGRHNQDYWWRAVLLDPEGRSVVGKESWFVWAL